jgi:phosphoserine aminotransferase
MDRCEREYFQNLLNFSAGPGALPYTVLRDAQEAIIEAPGLGSSVLGVSHRSEWFGELLKDTEANLRDLATIPDNYRVVFLQVGSSLLFSMIPMNFCPPQLGDPDYVVSGYWSKRALAEASKVTKCRVLFDGEKVSRCRFLLPLEKMVPRRGSAYLHYVSNETVEGTQFGTEVPVTDVPIIADMSSDFLSRPVDVSKFGMIYAHAQKNLGPAGVTVAIIRDDLPARCPDELPDMLNLRTLSENKSLYNTPNVFGIFVLNRMLKWVSDFGLQWLSERNRHKAQMLYETLDRHASVIRTFADADSRSTMNVPFHFWRESWDQEFLAEAKAKGFMGLEGHRTIGGIRASLYNGVSDVAVEELCESISQFVKRKTER